MEGQVIKVKCKCGYLLFRYFKDIKGRLLKCYLDCIRKDFVGLSSSKPDEKILCPKCNNVVGTVKMIHGRPAIKISQSKVQKTRT